MTKFKIIVSVNIEIVILSRLNYDLETLLTTENNHYILIAVHRTT